MKRKLLGLFLALFLWSFLQAQPIKLHPSNPHYFLYKGKPTLLITSAEHYGAVVNGDFDFKTYLKAIKNYGLNYTRIYPGGLFEPKDKFIKGNTLGIVPGNVVLPWGRSNQTGYSGGGNLFDLDKWNPAYFSRLKDFIREAARQDVVVEICFYNAQYDDTWPIHPLYYKNNIQGEGNYHFNDFQTLKHPDLVKRQDDYVRKIVQEVNSLDNIILEICDEPLLNGTPVKEAGEWIKHNISVIKETEGKLPKKHLIAQQLEGPENGPVDFSNDPDVSVIVSQYDWAAGDQMGGMQALDKKYAANKAIELNETDYYPVWYGKENDKVAASRVEAWEFMVGGGAGFNQLNGLYTAANPAGKTADNDQIGKALQSLKKFLYRFDFIRMAPDKNFVVSGLPDKGVFYRCISEPGKQVALYIHHSTRKSETYYQVTPGKYKEDLVVKLPKGEYNIEWINPADGKIISSNKMKVKDETSILTTPDYTLDVALRITKSISIH